MTASAAPSADAPCKFRLNDFPWEKINFSRRKSTKKVGMVTIRIFSRLNSRSTKFSNYFEGYHNVSCNLNVTSELLYLNIKRQTTIQKRPAISIINWFSSLFCGVDGSRTRVQTRNKYAFYMLIRLLVFEWRPVSGNLPSSYPLIFRCDCEKKPQLFPTHERLQIANRGTGFAGNVLSRALRRIKLIYYDSIRQQERNYFRHLLFCDPDLRGISRGSACLQYPFTLLSKPNDPMVVYCF